MQRVTANRFLQNLEGGRTSVGAVVTMSDLVVSELAGDFPRWKARGVDWFAGTSDWGAMAAGFRAFKKECDEAV